MCSSGTAKNILIYSTGWHLWHADNVTIHHRQKEWQKNKLHYCNSVIILVCSHELHMWKNRVNWRVLRSYHTTLRTWMSHFVSPTARLWIYGIITTFCLNKLPQMLPVSSVFFNTMDHDSSSDVFRCSSIPFFWKVTSIPSDSYSGKGKGSSCSGSLFSMFDASHSLWIGRFPT